MAKKYDYLIVGAGLFGSVCAHELAEAKKKVLVIDRRKTIGGNCYTDTEEGVVVHRYGPHIFHTSDKRLWDYVAEKIEIQPTPNYTPIAVSKGEVFNLPFNMNTFARLFGIRTPAEAQKVIREQRKAVKGTPANLKEQAISLVGTTVFERLVRGYTEKQWGRKCEELPPDIIKRLPVRFTYDNTYYNDNYIGIPAEGWTPLFESLLLGIDTELGADYNSDRQHFDSLAPNIIYTGSIDEFFDYRFGRLEYRSLDFVTTHFDGDYQGCAVMNWTDGDIPYTRSIEHKHFDTTGKREYKTSVITLEYPKAFSEGAEPYYPINNNWNDGLYQNYLAVARERRPEVVFGGRLGGYRYADMDDTIADALTLVNRLLWERR